MITSNKTQKEADAATELVPKPVAKESKFTALLFGIVVFVLLVAGLAAGYNQFKSKQQGERCSDKTFTASKSNIRLLPASGREYDIEVAKTATEHQKGLSGRDCLPLQSVMLFEFASADSYGIWMKDMKFAIDVVWLDQDKKIVGIEQSLQPETYPNTFYPAAPAQYVLEGSSGFAYVLGLQPGMQLQW